MPGGEFRPPADEQGEFEVEDLLDHRTSDVVLLMDWNILLSGRVILCLRQLGSLLRTSPTVLKCCLLISSAEDCAEPKGGVLLALCMTSLITLLCMRCAAQLRVACGLNFMYAEFLHCWV